MSHALKLILILLAPCAFGGWNADVWDEGSYRDIEIYVPYGDSDDIPIRNKEIYSWDCRMALNERGDVLWKYPGGSLKNIEKYPDSSGYGYVRFYRWDHDNLVVEKSFITNALLTSGKFADTSLEQGASGFVPYMLARSNAIIPVLTKSNLLKQACAPANFFEYTPYRALGDWSNGIVNAYTALGGTTNFPSGQTNWTTTDYGYRTLRRVITNLCAFIDPNVNGRTVQGATISDRGSANWTCGNYGPGHVSSNFQWYVPHLLSGEVGLVAVSEYPDLEILFCYTSFPEYVMPYNYSRVAMYYDNPRYVSIGYASARLFSRLATNMAPGVKSIDFYMTTTSERDEPTDGENGVFEGGVAGTCGVYPQIPGVMAFTDNILTSRVGVVIGTNSDCNGVWSRDIQRTTYLKKETATGTNSTGTIGSSSYTSLSSYDDYGKMDALYPDSDLGAHNWDADVYSSAGVSAQAVVRPQFDYQ